MNSAVQLALMAKAEKIFENDQTFLSFPVTPLQFTKAQLNFPFDQNLQHLQEFSSLVNLLPQGEAWAPTETRYLWDVYQDVLATADFASSTRTPAEETEYQKAYHYLHIARDDGTLEDTQFVSTYKQFKDAYLTALQTYQAAKDTADTSSNPAEKQHWQDVDEPALRSEYASWEKRWVNEGYRYEVEAAQNTVFQLGARSPITTWGDWKAQISKEIDTITSATDLTSAFITSYEPINALDETSWQPFRLTGDEVRSLVGESSADLRARFSIDTSDVSVNSVTFEFSLAIIKRPWFVPDVFNARFWRFSDGSKILSDGSTPPSGLCTAYVTALVFARHVVVEERQPNTNGQQRGTFGGFQFPLDIRLRPRPVAGLAHTPQVGVSPTRVIVPVRMSPTITPPSSTILRSRPVIAPPAVITASQQDSATARGKDLDLSSLLTRNTQRTSFNRIIVRRPPQTTNTPPPTHTEPLDEHISILAFICKELPVCPNPDPSLQW